MKTLVVIPARYQSSRLPGKPLVEIAGVPMIVRTYRQCAQAVPAEQILVATDDERIADVCRRENIAVQLTSPHCLTGTDRLAEVAESVRADAYINVQGDEPLFNPDDLRLVVEAAENHPGEILNGYAPIETEADFRSPSIPKVVMREDGRLLYMSRGAIPTTKALGFRTALRQIGVYVYPAAALAAFRAWTEKTPLEALEDIEILRFVERGYEVRMVRLSGDSLAVDEPEDVARVEARLQELGAH